MDKVRRVVLVDDNIIDCFLHRYYVKYLQVADEILVLHSARQALKYISDNYISDAIKQDGVDLILLDLVMPVNDGFSLLDEIRKLKELDRHKFKIIMVTVSVVPKDRLKAETYRDILKGYLIKPLEIWMLKDIIDAN